MADPSLWARCLSMSLAFDESSLSGRHRVTYRILDANRSFPVREVEVLATPEEIASYVRDGYLIAKAHPRERAGQASRGVRRGFRARCVADPGWSHVHRNFCSAPRGQTSGLPRPDRLCAFRIGGARASRSERAVARRHRSSLSSRQPSQETEWHFHQRVIPDPLPPLFMLPQTVDMLMYLDDARGKNGPLCVLPGSHRLLHRECENGNLGDLPDK